MTKLIGEKVLMRIFVEETDRYAHKPLYAGATVIRGISGFGAHSVYHTQKLLDISADLPLIVEVVDSQEKIDSIMPRIDEMMTGGMITLERAQVIRYTPKEPK